MDGMTYHEMRRDKNKPFPKLRLKISAHRFIFKFKSRNIGVFTWTYRVGQSVLDYKSDEMVNDKREIQ